MTSLNEIAHQLLVLSRDLDSAIAQLSDLEVVAVDTEAVFKTKFARTFRGATGSVEDRKQQATQECEAEFRAWGIASSTVRVQKESLKALHARIDVGRTLASTARAEISLVNSGVHT